MYNDLITIGNLTIHTYGLCTGLGIMAAILLADYRARKHKLSDDIVYGILIFGVLFGYIASKTTYILVEFDSFIKDPMMVLASNGFVVMGGLIGGFAAAWIYCACKKVVFADYLDLCAPSIAIAQCIGRIGCFFAGCCYGKVTDKWYGIAFKNSMFAPNHVKLIPTQLISAGLDLINMIILLIVAKKTKKQGLVGALYITLYSIGRFFIEYLRNDERGAIGGLSTSQAGSIVTLVIGIVVLVWALCHKKKVIEAVEETAAKETDKE